MKNKILILFIILITFSYCSNNEIEIIGPGSESYINFDYQDDILKIDSEFYNNENENFIIKIALEEKKIIISSENYIIQKIETIDFFGKTEIQFSENKKSVFIFYENINTHIHYSDNFSFYINYINK
jgi:hypothetical protein